MFEDALDTQPWFRYQSREEAAGERASKEASRLSRYREGLESARSFSEQDDSIFLNGPCRQSL